MIKIGIAWAAGLFEGEGTIATTIHRKRILRPQFLFTVRLNLTDEDVIKTFASIVKIGKIGGPYNYKRRRRKNGKRLKSFWLWSAYGLKGVKVIQKLMPYLHTRRRRQAQIAITQYFARPNKRKVSHG